LRGGRLVAGHLPLALQLDDGVVHGGGMGATQEGQAEGGQQAVAELDHVDIPCRSVGSGAACRWRRCLANPPSRSGPSRPLSRTASRSGKPMNRSAASLSIRRSSASATTSGGSMAVFVALL